MEYSCNFNLLLHGLLFKSGQIVSLCVIQELTRKTDFHGHMDYLFVELGKHGNTVISICYCGLRYNKETLYLEN